MDFAKFQRLVETRPGFQTMENPTASGEYFSDSCGDLYNFFVKIGPGAIVEDISYFTTGCGFGTATCSLVVELARGKTVDEALQITPAQIESELAGYPEKKKDYPERALEALKITIDDYRAKVASGAVPDFGTMPAPERPIAAPAETSSVDDGKVLIRLH
ncbi:MAG: iron-sulfur cluster assembly scaffold protein [Candidatus Eremiobacteraeota bacterium]|nr:iron-sulfur cluster assembly scaffold protein [Candidatus Eremiobacteraeota bacterium]